MPRLDPVHSGIARLLRGEALAPRAVSRRRSQDLVDGAVLETIGRHGVCVIRRPVRELLPGTDLERDLRDAFASLATRDPQSVYPGLRAAVGRRVEDLVVLDLETTGFWGCPIFLVGMILWEAGELISVQVLARDYAEEKAMLAASVSFLGARSLLATFNGKSYDVPCFRERCQYHRVPSAVHDTDHVDVLHASRRRWKGELKDCRLQTLEWEVVGLHRVGDVPSAEIPGVYHEFVATGDPGLLQPVLHHGRVDTVTTASLLARLLADPPLPIPRRPRKKTTPAKDID
ncbi:MAG: hypothetical protein DHS20C21_04140 [Gemmatimonadota bacterium]|nr:MAG: hypothetical protein DHS20C21_04140 [Gemmatimonadota bacterium]